MLVTGGKLHCKKTDCRLPAAIVNLYCHATCIQTWEDFIRSSIHRHSRDGIFSVWGCATTYRDKALDAPGATAPAVLVDQFGFSELVLFKVDAVKAGGFPERFELLPGEHTLTVGTGEQYFPARKMTLHFTAKPGQTYDLKAEMKWKPLLGKWHALVTEVSTGQKFESDFIDGSAYISP
jgi:hypothetical protein